ncbi:MAG: membrane protein insertase YidC [Ignavibacteria bacterium]|nr:membrane protein insertase YidC [Ignavibacteria bacterium]MDP3831525.1 membrane protein insertase YidC [Ignavibacteriaceae bacterium]
MDKQTTLAFVLIGIILMAWLYLTTPTQPPQEPAKAQDSTVVEKPAAPQKIEKVDDKPIQSKDSLSFGKFFSKSESAEEIITIENDVVIIEMTNRGGKIKKYFLKEFQNWYVNDLKENASHYQKNVQLINYAEGGSLDIDFVTSDGKAISTANLDFESNQTLNRFLVNEKDSLVLEYTTKAGSDGKIVKRFTFYGSRYDTKFDVEFVNMSKLISNNVYDIVWDHGIRFVENNSVDEANYSNASVHYGDEQVIVDAPHDDEKISKDFNGKVDWVTIRNKYFAAVIVPMNPANVEGAYIKGYSKKFPGNGIREYYSARLQMPFKESNLHKESFTLFIGPVDYKILENYPGELQKIVDFGSFFGLKFVVRPIAEYVLLPLFNFLHIFISNYGLVIIIFSLIIKVVLYPLTKQSFQSMKKMQALQPKIAELKEKFKDDPAKVNKETMKLYSTYGVNPAGGCLPMLLQMPIFIALWGLFQTAIELRQQPFFWWIEDLSRPDVIFDLGFAIPLFGISEISGLALLMGITTFVQQKQTIKDPQQQMLVYLMPVMLTFLFMSFPSGLNLYYFMFNVLSIAQQAYINRNSKTLVLEPVKNPNKKKGFMQKMMEAAENNAKSAQQKKKK